MSLNELNKILGVLTQDQDTTVSKTGEAIRFDRVCFITRAGRGEYAFVTDKGETMIVKTSFARLKQRMAERDWIFEKTENTTWVNLRKVVHATTTTQSRYLLHFKGISNVATVSRHYAGRVARALDVETLDHISPISTHGQNMRDLNLMDLGATELKSLDTTDKNAVKAYLDKWDIRKYGPRKLKELFGFEDGEGIEKSKLLTNLIWQQWLWIKAGILAPIIGNIKTFWYQNAVKSMLASVGYDPSTLNPSLVYGAFEKFMVLKLMTYRDFGFVDNLEHNRGIGEKLPHVMVYAEKEGQHPMISHLSREYGCSRLATNGQVPYITMEYFTRELKQFIPEDKTLTIFGFVDFNPDGHDILRHLGMKLEHYGLTNYKIIPLITLDEYTDEQIHEASSKLVTVHEYVDDDGILKYPAYTEADQGRHKDVTDWYYGSDIWPGIRDKRITLRRPHPKRGEIVTILGLDLDMFGYYGLKQIFYRKAKPWLGENAPPPLPAGSVEELERTIALVNRGEPAPIWINGKKYMLVEMEDFNRFYRGMSGH